MCRPDDFPPYDLTIGDLWCLLCADPAEDEYRQPDGSTVPLCHEHVLDQRWKEDNFNWQPQPTPA